MLKIRLQRVGRAHEPVYRLVLTDSKNSTKSGRYVEVLGSFDSRRGEKSEFKSDKIKEWIGKGAQLSGTVHNLLIDKKVIEGKKINVLPLKKAILKETPAEATVASEETPATPESKEDKQEDKIEDKAEEKTEEKVEEAPTPEATV